MGERPSDEEVRAIVAQIVGGFAPEDLGEATAHQEPLSSPERGTSPGGEGDIAIGADHGGFALKQRIAADLREHGFSVRDVGTHSTESVDYPDIAFAVAQLVADGSCRWGIVVDGAGIGSAIAANKVPGIRAATCWDISSARNSREHNHANVLALGAGLLGDSLALQIVQAWLSTGWGGDRHARRVDRITDIERRFTGQPAGRSNDR
jgi:ribose 5-phosphate isomerase B